MNRDTEWFPTSTFPWGINVIVNAHVPKGEMILLGKFDKPPNWDALTEIEQLKIAARHGVKIIVGPDLAKALEKVDG